MVSVGADTTDFHPAGEPPKPSHPTARKVQDALRTFLRLKVRRTKLFEFSGESAVGLDDVFVTLSAIDFGELKSMFDEQKGLSTDKIRELASKTWSERRENVQEITDLKRLLRLSRDGKPAAEARRDFAAGSGGWRQNTDSFWRSDRFGKKAGRTTFCSSSLSSTWAVETKRHCAQRELSTCCWTTSTWAIASLTTWGRTSTRTPRECLFYWTAPTKEEICGWRATAWSRCLKGRELSATVRLLLPVGRARRRISSFGRVFVSRRFTWLGWMTSAWRSFW